ncbi:glycosyltransferase [Halococcus saccharolyticus]|uniref:Family 2 glycosyl transferase n=1 Tax=Halococcus saccharolyticus DSM 5350 TaxID=1227455 RepID=M0MN41_9EURY|nr:glycosyltransferase [Halococcus saccharolyticus]EMA47061.1 family 2 glycosyl transferase [Halococcus saccharolyticus DSM 5350]
MGLVARITNTDQQQSTDEPFITVIVPSFTEAGVIARRVANLREQTYPNNRFEVLFVDSGSTDGTPNVIQNALDGLEPDDPSMKLLKQTERSGKASAINHGIEHGRGDVVLVTDANTVFVPETIERIAPHFADPTVGAVAGRLAVSDADSSLTASNHLYRDIEHMKAVGESPLDSVCQFVGEISAWRADLVQADETSLAEDLDLSVRIRKQGYRIMYESEALAYESEPDTVVEQITSKKRRVIGTIQVLLRHRDYLLIPGDRYRTIIFPSRKGLLMLSPFLCIGAAVCFLITLVVAPLAALGATLVTGSLGSATFAALLAVRDRLPTTETAEDGDKTEIRSNGMGNELGPDTSLTDEGMDLGGILAVVRYVAVIEYAILLAWWDFFSGKYSVRWEKSTSDR